MTSTQKQLLYATLGLIILGLLLFFGYKYFFSNKLPISQSPTLLSTNGGSGDGTTTVTPSGNSDTSGNETEPQPTLFQIHNKPIVGFVVFTRGANTYARFIEQGSGHVYEYNFDSKQKIRISNTSIPKIQTVSFAKDGNTVAFQYLENNIIRSAVGQLSTSSEEGSYKKITFLSPGLTSVALSPSGDAVAYTTSGQTGGVVGVVNKDGTGVRSIFSSPLTRWLISWPSKDAVLVESPLSSSGGIAFSVNTKTKSTDQLVAVHGYFSGLVGAQDGIHYLYSPSWSKGVTRYNSKNNTEFVAFSMNTTPDKCSFMATSTDFALCASGSGSSAPILANLEAWLRGEGSVEDSLYLVNFRNASWTPIIRTEDVGDKTFDIEHVESDARNTFGAFKERVGETLWGIWVRPELLR